MDTAKDMQSLIEAATRIRDFCLGIGGAPGCAEPAPPTKVVARRATAEQIQMACDWVYSVIAMNGPIRTIPLKKATRDLADNVRARALKKLEEAGKILRNGQRRGTCYSIVERRIPGVFDVDRRQHLSSVLH